MRITYRNKDVKDYWESRWSNIPADEPMSNTDTYPLKYALLSISSKNSKVLEAGCGAGRIIRFFHEKGYQIDGFDYIETAISKLKTVDPSLSVKVGDITALDYPDNEYDCVLAFGLYHNLQDLELRRAILETHRILKSDGLVCASFRADNIQNILNDAHAQFFKRKAASVNQNFHKLNLTLSEFKRLFTDLGFAIEQTAPVENMPILYKFKIFRHLSHKVFNENLARSEGYRLSPLGSVLQRFLIKNFPNQFCNVYALIARKI